jgi:hypothetical protein
MTDFSAKEPALGYWYQARYALWQLLEGPEDQQLVLESLDDIVVESPAGSAGLVQTKHHINAAVLTDFSPDLWKTLRIWSDHLRTGAISIPPMTLTLVTTGTAPQGSIASLLRPNAQREADCIAAALLKVARESKNEKLQASFTAFAALSDDQRTRLINAISILDKSPDIADVRVKIEEKIRLAVDRDYRTAVLQRLEGWWFERVAGQFLAKDARPVTGFEVSDMVRSIADQFGPSALPIDFLRAEPDTIDPGGDDRTFVKQLRDIDVGLKRIEKAILDYYRAFEQRSRWAKDELLIGGEIEKYEETLIDEWERFAEAVAADLSESASEEVLREAGRSIFNWVDLEADYRIRPDVAAAYVMRGSYHILANATPPRVWWHPKFLERISAIVASNVGT